MAVVTLVAFLAANSHAVTHAGRPTPHDDCGHHALTCCAYCHPKLPGADAQDDESPASPADPTSPDDGFPCPSCPWGCAVCGVAKAPCLVPAAPLPDMTPRAGDGPDEVQATYTPPFADTHTRPPRA
jgi:hypothetical protein